VVPFGNVCGTLGSSCANRQRKRGQKTTFYCKQVKNMGASEKSRIFLTDAKLGHNWCKKHLVSHAVKQSVLNLKAASET
jgi:hypothetical protein